MRCNGRCSATTASRPNRPRHCNAMSWRENHPSSTRNLAPSCAWDVKSAWSHRCARCCMTFCCRRSGGPAARPASMPSMAKPRKNAAIRDAKDHPALAEARRVLEVESAAILGLIEHLDRNFVDVVELINASNGRVVTMGLGKSGIICKKISATLASTGTPSFFLHPAEAIHGDLGMIVRGDVVLAISNSGETEELVRLLPSIKRIGAEIVAMTGNPLSTLAKTADYHLSAAISREACPLGLAPTASTTATLALGDALAMALLLRKGFKEEDFAFLHPGGKLGKRFLRVHDLMHSGEQLPSVRLTSSMRDAISEMSKKRFGITAVVDDDGVLKGAISDGDLRRLLEKDETIIGKTAGQSMTENPITIEGTKLASAALQIMEERKITSLFITDESGRVEGIIHIHDLWG